MPLRSWAHYNTRIPSTPAQQHQNFDNGNPVPSHTSCFLHSLQSFLFWSGNCRMQSMVLSQTVPRLRVSPVTVEWITRTADIRTVAGEWKALESTVKTRTVFSSYDLLAAWYGNYAGDYGGEPLIGLARRGARLVGVVPLAVLSGCLGKIPLNRVQFATHDAYSGEFLVEDDHPEIISAFLDSLAGEKNFDLIALNAIEPGTPQFQAIEDPAKRHRLAIEMTNHPNAIVDLKNGYDSYCQAMSRNFRRTLKRQAQRVGEAGEPAVDGVRLSSGIDRLDSSIERLYAITEASYKLKGERLRDDHRGYLGDLARNFAARDMLHLSILSIGGRDAAVVMGLVERGCYYDVTLSSGEEFAALSPGAYLMQQVLRDLSERGVHTLVSHGAHDYKLRWSTAFVPSTRLFLFSRSTPARMSRFVRFRLSSIWKKLGATDP